MLIDKEAWHNQAPRNGTKKKQTTTLPKQRGAPRDINQEPGDVRGGYLFKL